MNTYSSITLPEAQDVLRRRMPSLTQSLAEAWKTWWDDLSDQHGVLDASTRAMIINRNFYFRAQQHLGGDRGVVSGEDQLQRYIVFDERLIVRFKLLGRNLEASNYPTTRAQEWVQQLPLPGIPLCERLHFGYRLNLTTTAIEDAFVTLPNGIPDVINDWVWQVWGNPLDFSTFGIQRPLPKPPQTETVVYAYDDFSVRVA